MLDLLFTLLKNDMCLASVSTIVQSVAASCIPNLYQLSKESTLQICEEAVFRAERNKLELNIVVKNVSELFSNPSLFASKLDLAWKYSVPNGVFDNYPILGPQECLPFNESIKDHTDYFLMQFAKRGLFSLIYTFYYTLEYLSYFPPEVHIDRISLFSLSYGFLSKCIFNQFLRKAPLFCVDINFISLLSRIICRNEIRFVADKNTLSSWYSIILMTLTSKYPVLIQEALTAAADTIQIGFSGSTCLIPPILYYFENLDITSEAFSQSFDTYFGFIRILNSPALFQADIPLPTNFYNQLCQNITEDQLTLCPTIKDIIMDSGHGGKNIKSRYLSLLSKFSPGNIDFLPVLMVALVEELCLDNPDPNACLQISDLICVHLKTGAEKSLQCIRGLLQYFPKLCTISSQSVSNLAYALLSFMDRHESYPFIRLFSLIRCATSFLISAFAVAKDLEITCKFGEYLKKMAFSKKPLVAPSPTEEDRKSIDPSNEYSKDLKRRASVGSFSSKTGPHLDVEPDSAIFQKYVRNDLELFMHEFGAVIFETNLESQCKKGSIFPFKTPWNTIFRPKNIINDNNSDNNNDNNNNNNNDNNRNEINSVSEASLSNLTISGQYVWNFSPVSDNLLTIPNNSNDNGFSNLGMCISLRESEGDKVDSSFQTNFTSTISSAFDEMGIDKHEDTLGNSVDGIISRITKMNNTPNVLPNEIIRPTTKTDLPTISALKVIGIKDEQLLPLTDEEETKTYLDKAYGLGQRFGIKAALLSVNEGTEDQNSILSISHQDVSPHFIEFLDGLGWILDTETHHGYTGGLDFKDGRCGKSTCYAPTQEQTLMFHVAPLLPTNTKDPQQVLKKRHVGNDRVLVFWIDREKEYDGTTITSQFGQLQLIIYPLSNGNFRVHVEKKTNNMAWFCPLTIDSVVSKRALPGLIRATVGNSTEAAWIGQKDFEHPIMEEASFINSIIQNHVQEKPCNYFDLIGIFNHN